MAEVIGIPELDTVVSLLVHGLGRLAIKTSAHRGTNVINHPSFGVPNDSIGNASVGKITATSVSDRTVQLGARLSF